jgi:hypothetical protein
MKKNILRYLKHMLFTFLALLIIGIIVIISIGGSIHYGDHPLLKNLDQEGPYAFYEGDSILNIKYIRGNKSEGFYVEEENHSANLPVKSSCYFPLDSSSFSFTLTNDIQPPPSTYQDDDPILAISDIEGGYKTFRDFLINNKVIDEQLNWIFGKGHLVLLGDFIDRGYSSTQVLWLIYRLEQDAQKEGGQVHYILGNHELYNLQGNYKSAAKKYYGVAAILEKQPSDLYSSTSFLGRWLSSKNAIERINGHLFAHGGLHPDIVNHDIDLDEINQIVRAKYYYAYYPKTQKTVQQLLTSNRTGVAWYRGYFKDDLALTQIDKLLQVFNAKTITVGHTLQSKVNRKFEGKVIAIDVPHPKDYQKNFPITQSEGLLIVGDKYYRALYNGELIDI